MKEYKENLIRRIGVLAGICILFLACVIFRLQDYMQTGNEAYSDFLQGFIIGIVLVIEIYSIMRIVRYVRILGKEDLLKREYYKENDERARMIYDKTGGTALYGCAVIMLVAAIVAGYFEIIVSLTLIGCSFFLLAARKVLKFYYGRKF